MKFIETGDPDILQTRGGGGLAMVFGIVFLLTGLIVIGLSMVTSGNPPWYVPAAFGTVFFIIGTALTFGRTGMVINRRKRTVLEWYGLMVPMKSRSYQLQYYNRLVLKKELRRSEHSSYYAYPLCLSGSEGTKKDLVIADPEDYVEGRSAAEKIASFLNFPLLDITLGEETIREPHELNKSFRQREKQLQKPLFSTSLAPPPHMISTVKESGNQLLIHIPPTRISLKDAKRAFALATICIVAFIIVNGGLKLENLKPERLITYAPIIIIFLLVTIRPLLRSSKESWNIFLSEEILQVEKIHKGRKESKKIPLSQMEDFLFSHTGTQKADNSFRNSLKRKKQAGNFQFITDLFIPFPSKGITARSDKTSIHFGKGVDEEEMRYIYELMKKRIVGD